MAAATYTFHLPHGAAPDDPDAADRARVVRDAFSWGAFVAPMLWYFAHRHWLAGVVALVVVLALAALLFVLGLGVGTIVLAELLLHLLHGFEGPSLRRWLLGRSGRPVADVVTAGSADEAEAKGFARWIARESAMPAAETFARPAMPTTIARGREPVLGLFPDFERGRP